MNYAEEFRRLTLLLSEGDETLSADVVLSEEDPAAYVEAHAAELRRRGIDRPIHGLPWIALVDGLEEKGRLIELDWKESGEMFVQAVMRLLANEQDTEQASSSLNLLSLSGASKTRHVLERINHTLEPYGYAVIMIDINADCYPIALTRRAASSSIMELANRIEQDRIRPASAPI